MGTVRISQPRFLHRYLGAWIALAFVTACLGGAASAQTPPATPAATACSALPTHSFERLPAAPAWITSATVVTPSSGAAYCELFVHIAQSVGMQMRLPLTNWNGKFWMNGNHGLGGQYVIGETDIALAQGYAVAAADMGHHTRADDAGWADHSLQGKIDFGYRATHVASADAKGIVTNFYGHPIAYAYFVGWSTGGRQALMEAERYPEDFNGIIAGPAPIWVQEMQASDVIWTEKADRDAAGRPILDVAKLPLIHNAAVKACDGGDGLHDGLIVDPRTCHWDPQSLQCPGNVPAATCLTAAEVGVVRKFYQTPHDSSGRPIYPGGLMRGSEMGWADRLPRSPAPISRIANYSVDYMRYLAFATDAGPTYDLFSYNFDRDPERLAANARIYDATNPDLRAFRARGGKLIMFSGWADEAMVPLATVKFYDEIVAAAGGVEKAQSFVRLFMIPGQNHDPKGDGPILAAADFLPALEAWVETNAAPAKLIATEKRDGAVTRTRPVFPYPYEPHYTGSGDPNDAANFTAVRH
jgi:pimeloyl-ACP methyl ester carboxylesterase